MINSRYGKLIVFLKYRPGTPNTNKLTTTVSQNCYFRESSKNMKSILGLYPDAESIQKATFNGRLIT